MNPSGRTDAPAAAAALRPRKGADRRAGLVVNQVRVAFTVRAWALLTADDVCVVTADGALPQTGGMG